MPSRTVTFSVAPEFEEYAEAALLRFGYLNPDLSVSRDGATITVSGEARSGVEPRRELLHLIYREKIYAETLRIRQKLYESLGT